jgi:tetraacyldisaccharide 4'-kinase
MRSRHAFIHRVWLTRSWPAYVLWPLSCLYGCLFAIRSRLYRWRLKQRTRLPVPVVVVGNVVVGGTGKTPIVIALVEHLVQQGWRPGVVSRGHGRDSQGTQEVSHQTSAQFVGDEPALIWQRCKVPVVVGHQRVDAAKTLLSRHPDCNVIISDDGLQHLGLDRDIEILVFDDRQTGNGFLLPAGPLREPWPRPADFLLYTGQQFGPTDRRVRRRLATSAQRADGSQMALASLITDDTASSRLLGVAAIAQPELFFNMLREQGIVLCHTVALPDHARLDQWQAPAGQDWIVLCTEKDALKLWPHQPDAWAVPLVCELPAEFLRQFDRLLHRKQTQPVSLTLP